MKERRIDRRTRETPKTQNAMYFLFEAKQAASGIAGLDMLARRATQSTIAGNANGIVVAKEIKSFLQEVRGKIEERVPQWLNKVREQGSTPYAPG